MSDENSWDCRKPDIWVRVLFMAIFAVIYSITEVLIGLVAILQLGFAIFTQSPNNNLTRFGQSLSMYAYHIFRFVTFNSEYKPFPFDEWQNLGPDKPDQSVLEEGT